MSVLSSLGAGGGVSASSSASTGPSTSGDIGGSSFSFEGINSGTRSALPPAVWYIVAIGAVILGGFYLFKRK